MAVGAQQLRGGRSVGIRVLMLLSLKVCCEHQPLGL